MPKPSSQLLLTFTTKHNALLEKLKQAHIAHMSKTGQAMTLQAYILELVRTGLGA